MHPLILEFDDLHWSQDVNCIHMIEKLVERFPPIILNFFVPAKYGGHALNHDMNWCNAIRKFIDKGNVNLAVHGLVHDYKEFERLQYKDVRYKLQEAEVIFNAAKLPYQKVFRGPYWAINRPTYEYLIDDGYTHVYSHVSYNNLNTHFASQIEVVYYNWNLKDNYGQFENQLSLDKNIIVAHGHTSSIPQMSCGNGIEESYNRICHALENNSFTFLGVHEY